MKPRMIAVLAHRYVGLATAIFLAVAGLTGSIIAFNHELDELLNPSLLERRSNAPVLPALDIVERVEAAYPGLYVSFVDLEIDPAHNLVASVSERRIPGEGEPAELPFNQVFIDPATGEVVGTREWGAFRLDAPHLIPFIYKLHYSLHLPGVIGLLLMGIVAILWTIDCMVGFYLTLPRGGPFWKKWGPAWRIKKGATGHRFNIDFHRAAGLWLWPLLFMLAMSGVALNLPDQVFRPIVSLVADLSPSINDLAAERQGMGAEGEPKLGFSDALALAEQQAPEHGITQQPGMVWHPRTYAAIGVAYGEHHGTGLGNSWMFFDDRTGDLLHVEIPGAGTGGDTFVQLQFPLHSGQIIGLPGRIIISVAGLITAALSITGILIWWRKRKPARARARAARPAAA